ncbi:MAG: phytoene desaturase family protein [Peptostreptococcaceae bacterium]
MKKVIIVGAGIGGLCTGIRLLKEGYKVEIIEKENKVGGKVNQINEGDSKFDLTATILMTPQIYTELFTYINKDYTKYIDLIKLDTMYKIFYDDNTTYEIYGDISKTIRFLENIDNDIARSYLDFISNTYKKYLISNEEFLEKSMVEFREMVNFKNLKYAIKANPISSADKYISKYIKDDKLRDSIIFQTMYIGINPYKTSNLYTLIPTISQLYGLWYIKGGMYSYVTALEKVFKEMGGDIYLNTEVNEILIKEHKVLGVNTDRKKYSSDIVVCNADFPYALKNLVKQDIYKDSYNQNKIDKMNYSCSTFIMYIVLKKKYKNLKVHNIYRGKNFKENIEAPFKGEIPKNPSLYMYCPSKVDNSMCEKGKEIINIMIRVPNLAYENIKWDRVLIKDIRAKVINSIKQIKGMEDIEKNIIYENYLTPKDLEEKFNAYNGCAFGIGHNLNQVGYFRPHIRSKSVKGLYFIGSSTHPGNGVSVIINGSKVVVEEILKNS